MGLLTPGWLKKALHLRVIISCAPIKDLSPHEVERFEAMRAWRRGPRTDETALELQRRIEEIPKVHTELLHEPLDAYGWSIKASICGMYGQVYWLVGVLRTGSAAREKDMAMLAKIFGVLGCDDLERDSLSVGAFEDNMAEGIPFMYLWRNTIELQEFQFHPGKPGRDGMRIVPRGSRATDGFEKIPD